MTIAYAYAIGMASVLAAAVFFDHVGRIDTPKPAPGTKRTRTVRSAAVGFTPAAARAGQRNRPTTGTSPAAP